MIILWRESKIFHRTKTTYKTKYEYFEYTNYHKSVHYVRK